jgi:N-acetylglucosamine-6-phosphate deacetylase
VVRDGQARLAESGSLAGSTVTMVAAVGRALADGASVDAVASAAAGRPAKLLGVTDRLGSIAPGRPARLVLLDAKYQQVELTP